MARSAVQVTRVTSGDEESFIALWRTSKLAEGHSDDQVERALRDGRLTRACARSDVRAYTASIDGEPVGFTMVMSGPVSALQETPAVWVDVLWVKPGRRQRGVAGALLKALLLWLLDADDLGKALHRAMDVFAEAAELDRGRVQRWAQLHAVQGAFWARRHGFRVARGGLALEQIIALADGLAEALTE